LLGNAASQNGPWCPRRTVLRGPDTANMASSTAPSIALLIDLVHCSAWIVHEADPRFMNNPGWQEYP
jgi:hypothetical protein